MLPLVNISCRGLNLGERLGRKVAAYSGRMTSQTTANVQKEAIIQARRFSSSCSRATVVLVSPGSFPRPATRLVPRCQYLNTRLYQHSAFPPESEDGEAKRRTNLKDSSPSSPLKSTTVSPSVPESSSLKAPTSSLPESLPKSNPPDPIPTNAQQRQTDWGIIKRLMSNVWPRNDWKTRLTVLGGFGLLVSAKVGLYHSLRKLSSKWEPQFHFFRSSTSKSPRFSKQ